MTEQQSSSTLSRESSNAFEDSNNSSSSTNFECSEASSTRRTLLVMSSKEETAFSDSMELVTQRESVLSLRSICTVFEGWWDAVQGLGCVISPLLLFPKPHESPPLTSADCPKFKLIPIGNTNIFTLFAETFFLSFVLTKTHLPMRMKLSFFG